MGIPSAPRPRAASSGGFATQDAPPFDLPLRFFAVGLGALALMMLVYPWHVPLLLGSFYDPHLIAFVHVNTLGFITAVVFGASYQILPIVLQTSLASVRLGRLSWWLYLPGFVAFVLGLSQGRAIALGAGGVLLFLAIAVYVAVVTRTLLRAPHRDVTFWHVMIATAGLAVAASLGILLALSKHVGFLGDLTLPTLAAHVTLMLGGWITPLLAGVAYRLVAMFTLTEDRLRASWAWTDLALAVGGAWLLAASLLFRLGPVPSLVGAAALLAGLVVFAAQLLRLYHLRPRRKLDVHMPFALVAIGYGLLASLLLVWGFVAERPPTDPIWVAAGWLAIAGWAETAIQGFLYKIGTFLTWLHRYAPLAGRQRVPMLEDLYDRPTALVGWACWTAGVALSTGAALARAEPLAYAGGISLSAGVGALLLNALRVGLHWRRTERA
jgi:hypothetical protein